ncbi:MAG TPA: hypothetical protein VGD61_11220 [Pyrinomonadaceae bacterium]
MKQETNNEMDLLLRRLGRQQDVFAPDAEGHLDADELNAYAENALPATARLRYTDHLAECGRCRELVVQLSAAAGVVAGDQTIKVGAPSGLKAFLASLFSPMVLRYAVPALGLVVVAVIGFAVLRRNAPGEYVSQRQVASPTAGAQTEAGKDQSGVTYSLAKPTDSVTDKGMTSQDAPHNSANPAPGSTPVGREENARSAKAPAEQVAADSTASQPASAAAPPTPAAKVDALSDERKQKNEDEARKQEAEVTVGSKEVSKRDFEMDKSANKKAEEPAAARARPAKSAVGGFAVTQGAGVASTTQQREQAGKDDKDASSETRSVAGRNFRKQRGVWTDTAYNGSKENMIVTRGSEGYRGLIADEPAIKTIADQLDGEIIVVWKGRIYRIR